MQKSVLIMGYGITGKECAKYFENKKYKVFIYDEKDIDCKYQTISNLEQVLKNNIKLCITSPSINIQENMFCCALKQHNVKVITEIEYSLSKIKGKTIAVTGTNGKSTTVSLIFDLLKTKYHCILAGNIGKPLISFIDEIKSKTRVVIEISSFMLANMQNYKFDYACLLNLTCDHLNWHKDIESYFQSKLKIFLHRNKKCHAIINTDDKEIEKRTKHLKNNVWCFSKNSLVSGCFVRDGQICFYDEKFEDVLDIKDIKLIGEKNLENVLCAVLVAKLNNIKNQKIKQVVSSFVGLKHRIEYCGEVNLVKYYNDSKATNISSTLTAVNCFSKNVVLMLGGLCKNQNFIELFNGLPNCIKYIVIFGKDRENIYSCAVNFLPICCMKNTFDEAFNFVSQCAESGDVVLFSPACASFDEFRNFEHRGEVFCEKVKSLKKT